MSLTSNALFTFRRNLPLMGLNSNNANYFTFAAKATPWPDDNNPPSVNNSVSTLDYELFNQIIFGKKINPSNISNMTNNYRWTSGLVYAMYDDQDPLLFTKQFYVMTYEAGVYNIFKCLNNNNGSVSLQQPLLAETSADDQFYQTSDGYQWKYMYSFDTDVYNTFVTPAYIPVIANSAVVGNAQNGALESYLIQSVGGNYNSYTNGYFTDIAVGGNTQFFGIQGDDTTIIQATPNSYSIGETITQIANNSVANGTLYSENTANSTAVFLTLKNVQGIFNNSNTINGVTSGSKSSVMNISSPVVSSNINFYNGCSLYISSGTGAGQLNLIDEYVVVGNARRVLLANAFAITPDLTSKYIISPSVIINGDGTGAKAYTTINPATNQLNGIQIISRGSGYSYANVSIQGNTGSLAITANNANVRAIISPRGGHGSDPLSELNATYLSFSTTFANTENGVIPGTGSTYRVVGLISDPLFANVTLTYSYSFTPTFPFVGNSNVYGSISGATGLVSSTNPAGNTITLTNVSGVFQSGDVLTATATHGSLVVNTYTNKVVTSVVGQGSVFNNRTILECPSTTLIGGIFSISEKIVQSVDGVDIAYGYIQDIETSGSNTYIYLSETYGTFNSSDTINGVYKYIYDDATRRVSIQVNDIVQPDLVKYTGNILYIENSIPITRNASQSELINIITGFN